MIKNNQTQTIIFKKKPKIIGYYSVVGPKEKNGFFGPYFDYTLNDDSFGEDSYEKAERKILEHAVLGAVEKAKLQPSDISVLLSGDLLNQIISSTFTARQYETNFIGLYGACSTMAESMAVGSTFIESGLFDNVVCATVSHFSSAERQYRFPLELGNQRPPTSQWTVTGAGALVLSQKGEGPVISMATIGKVVDWGICDVNNMGAAMAPAAMSTLVAHFKETKTRPEDYDLVVTGDLGKHGSEVLIDLMEEEGYVLGDNYGDCGQMYYKNNQKVFMGGSGCGCSASVLNSYILRKVEEGEYNKVLFVPTGALLSPLSCQQGDTIPCIAHAIVIEKGVAK